MFHLCSDFLWVVCAATLRFETKRLLCPTTGPACQKLLRLTEAKSAIQIYTRKMSSIADEDNDKSTKGCHVTINWDGQSLSAFIDIIEARRP